MSQPVLRRPSTWPRGIPGLVELHGYGSRCGACWHHHGRLPMLWQRVLHWMGWYP